MAWNEDIPDAGGEVGKGRNLSWDMGMDGMGKGISCLSGLTDERHATC